MGAEDQTALHLACDVACPEGDEIVKVLTDHGSDVHAHDAALRTPLLVRGENYAPVPLTLACLYSEYGATKGGTEPKGLGVVPATFVDVRHVRVGLGKGRHFHVAVDAEHLAHRKFDVRFLHQERLGLMG